jgi:hypothetical protein
MKRLVNAGVPLLLLFLVHSAGNAQQKDVSVADPDVAAGSFSAIPAIPHGRSTILGGSIRNVDPVLDRFTLNIMGEKPMKILFDERTQIFLDGKKIPLRDLREAEHASVQTTLDGTSVFAISVHILSRLQHGDYRGEIAAYNSETGDLDVVSAAGGDPVRVRVSSDTKFARKGQAAFTSSPASAADLQRGTLISLQFEPDGKGRGSVTEIAFLATPGSRFVFSGNLIALDTHAGTMVLLDPRNNETYQIAFNEGATPTIQNLHSGQSVRVTAKYDGTRYLAEDVTPN